MEEERFAKEVQRLTERLDPLPDPVSKPALVVVSGLPGTGKSYFSRRLAERLPFAVLETDDMRKTLFPSPRYTARESYRLFQSCHILVEQLLRRGTRVILDATNLVERHRERLYHIADRLGAKLIIVWVEAPPEVVRQRLAERVNGRNRGDHSDADWTVYEKMRPTVQEIRRNHLVVDTSYDIAPAIDKVVRELRG